MDTEASLPPPVATLLAALFPGEPVAVLAPTVGGFANLSLVARIGARRCVVKAAALPTKRADLRREAAVLSMLRGQRLAAPAPLAFAEGGGWAVLVTRHRQGTPGVALFAGPPAALLAPCAALGRALARTHASSLLPAAPLPPAAPPPPAGAGLLIAERAAGLAATLGDLPLPPELRAPLAAALDHPAWRPPAPRLVHGDAGLHNILWGPRGLTLLDWELAGWGDPRLDLAWAAWTMRFRGLPAAHWEALLTGYGREQAQALGLADEVLRALALGQAATLLARAAGRPEVWDEWLRRVRGTLHLNQIAPG